MQETVSIIVVRYGQKFPSLGSRFGITRRSLVMPYRDPNVALKASDLQRDTRGTYRRLETRLEEYWMKYMGHEMSTTAFLRACGSLYGARPTAPVPGVDEWKQIQF